MSLSKTLFVLLSTGSTQEDRKSSRHGWKFVDWDVKPQNKQNGPCLLIITSTWPGSQIRVCNEKLFSYFSTKTYVVVTQKNRLTEMVLLSTQNMFKLMHKKIITILRWNFFCLTGPMPDPRRWVEIHQVITYTVASYIVGARHTVMPWKIHFSLELFTIVIACLHLWLQHKPTEEFRTRI